VFAIAGVVLCFFLVVPQPLIDDVKQITTDVQNVLQIGRALTTQAQVGAEALDQVQDGLAPLVDLARSEAKERRGQRKDRWIMFGIGSALGLLAGLAAGAVVATKKK
jgi:hypothetical protein